jgi:hypothetical protein
MRSRSHRIQDLPLRAPSSLVRDDSASNNFSKLFEFSGKPLLVHVPAQTSDEEILRAILGDSSSILRLGLLCDRLRGISGFTLLGDSLLLIALATITFITLPALLALLTLLALLALLALLTLRIILGLRVIRLTLEPSEVSQNSRR